MKKGKSWCGLFFAMAALAIASSLAVSQTATIVPPIVKFSRTVAGAPSRIVGITFAYYKEQQGGAPLWMETQSVSLDGSDRYNAQLGATLPAGLPKDSFASGHGAIASGNPTTRMWVVFKVQTTSASVSRRVGDAVGKIHRAHDAPSQPLYEENYGNLCEYSLARAVSTVNSPGRWDSPPSLRGNTRILLTYLSSPPRRKQSKTDRARV